MNGHIALGAFCVVAALGGVGVLFRYRPAAPAPSGRHRAPVAAIEAGPVPVEALDLREVRCPVCRRDTEHVRFAVLNGLMCLDCRPREAS